MVDNVKPSIQQIDVLSRNTELPYFPNFTWDFLDADLDNKNLDTCFTWIQAFYDSTQIADGIAKLVIWSGHYFSDKVTPILSEVCFSYSGERVHCKGKALFTTGLNCRGQTVTTSAIDSGDPTAISKVTAYGGMQ